MSPTAAAASEAVPTSSFVVPETPWPPSPPVAIRASTTPTSTVAPTSTAISCTTPAAGDGTSVSILSVEIETIGSS